MATLKTSFARSVKRWRPVFRNLVALMCSVLLLQVDPMVMAQAEDAATIPSAQLDSLVAPIALFPDPLLSQVLVASTYPLEIIQLQQWLVKNKSLKGKALEEAVKKQDWDPSIQAMAALPDMVKRLADDIKWTTDLGNAFLAQQSDVMDAVQRMRRKAQEKGTLKSTKEQKVETQVVESKTVVVIEQADPQVVYVPSYDPVVVYGAPVYPYPPIYYPPAGYYAAGAAISFGVGLAIGAAWGGGCGWGCGWGHNDININVNNNFVNNYNRQNNIKNANRGQGKWQHNPQHRGGAPYGNRATANKFGGTARGDSMSKRQASARQQAGRTSGGRAQAGSMDRGSGGRGGAQAGTMDRGSGGRGGAQAGTMDRGSGRGSSDFKGGGGDRVGNRSVSSTSDSRGKSAFGGSGSRSGTSTRASSSRGSSSWGGSRGGFGGGGGGRGGGRRR